MHAHVLAHFAEKPYPVFPFLCLTVSGGHTQIIKVEDHLKMTILGETIDDAAGEAFDKTGKMLGLPYPAGPIIDKYAKEGVDKFQFSKPKVGGLDFSFSGLKTSILYYVRDQMKLEPEFLTKEMKNICCSVQRTIIEILMAKLLQASRETGIKHIAIAGGVSANSGLRQAIKDAAVEEGWTYHIPQFQYCSDNAAMIGITAYYKYLAGDFTDQSVTAEARMVF